MASYTQTTQSPATIPEPSEELIVEFHESVSKEVIDEYVARVISAGGKIKYSWYLEEDHLLGNAFVATVPISSIQMFKSLKKKGDIKHIEGDGIVTIKEDAGVELEAPDNTQVA